MYNYCTLFDSFYLSRGLAMYESLKANAPVFHLFIFAFDDTTLQIIKELNLSDVTLISLSDFESPELLEVKKIRSKAEYCWTSTPSTVSYVLDKYKVSACTYIDADLIFYSDPSILIDEMLENKKNILITEHRYSLLPRIYEEKRSGRFCVQFVTFTNEADSLHVLEKWRLQCIEWCYARHEDGKFGDQKYLDEWPGKYNNVHILKHLGGGIAPWNLQQYKFTGKSDLISGIEKKTGINFKVVFFHFQYVKFIGGNSFDIGWYAISIYVKNLFYKPYLEEISEIENKLKLLSLQYQTGLTTFKANNLKNFIKIGFKSILGYNIMKLKS